MLSNIITKLSKPSVCHQQVRFAFKTYRYKYAYGAAPKITEDDYREFLENDDAENLKFEKIRFAKVGESSSYLFDKDYETFTKYVMKGGRRDLADHLMQETFYHVKCIQYSRWRKQQEKKQSTGGAKKDEQSLVAGEDDEEIELNPLNVLKAALNNSEPVVVTKKIKRGGANYQVPFPINSSQGQYLARKWLIGAVLDRPKPRTKQFPDVMAQELIDASHNRGKVVKRKDDLHKLADANKAYAHYRWG